MFRRNPRNLYSSHAIQQQFFCSRNNTNFSTAYPKQKVVADLFKRKVISSPQDENIKRLQNVLVTNYYELDDESKVYNILFEEMLIF